LRRRGPRHPQQAIELPAALDISDQEMRRWPPRLGCDVATQRSFFMTAGGADRSHCRRSVRPRPWTEHSIYNQSFQAHDFQMTLSC